MVPPLLTLWLASSSSSSSSSCCCWLNRRRRHPKKAWQCAIVCSILILPAFSVLHQLLTRPILFEMDNNGISSISSSSRTLILDDAPSLLSETILKNHHHNVGTDILEEEDSSRISRNESLLVRTTTTTTNSSTTEQQRRRRRRLPFCLVHIGKTAGGSVSCRLGGAPRLAKQCPDHDDAGNTSHLITTTAAEPPPLSRFCVGKLHKQRDWGCFAINQPPRSNKNRHKMMTNKKNVNHTTTATATTPVSVHTFLFTLRDPIDRIRSWFYYEHPTYQNVQEPMGARRDLFWDCNYTTLDELAQLGLAGGVALQQHQQYPKTTKRNVTNHDDDDPRTSPTCAQRAWKAVTGQTGYLYHNRFNYQYYLDWTKRLVVEESAAAAASNTLQKQQQPTQLRVLVIRQEHLKEDWNSLESMYADDEPLATTTTTTTTDTKQEQQERLVVVKRDSPSNRTDAFFDVVQLHRVKAGRQRLPSGGDGQDAKESKRHGRSKDNDDILNPLSPKSWPYLCEALCREIIVYRDLLERAENLQPWQREMSLRELAVKCPKQAAAKVICRPDPTFSI